jgi:hypothetical protein
MKKALRKTKRPRRPLLYVIRADGCVSLTRFRARRTRSNTGRMWLYRCRTGVCLVRPFVVPCPVSRSPHPVQMRAGRGPVSTERVHGLEGPVRGERAPGGERVLLSFVLPVSLPLVFLSLRHRWHTPHSQLCSSISLSCKSESLLQGDFFHSFKYPHWFGNRSFVRRHLVVVFGGGEGWWRRSRFSVCFVAPPFGP